MAKTKKRSKNRSSSSTGKKKTKTVSSSTDKEKMAKSGSDSDDSENSKQDTENIHEDTIMLEFDDTRFYMKYITLKMTLDSNAGAIEALREKYALLKTTLLEADETIIFLPINPKKNRRSSKTG